MRPGAILLLVLWFGAVPCRAGVWSDLPDAVARLEVMPRDRTAMTTVDAAQTFLVNQARAGRLPAVVMLHELYTDLMISLPDGDDRIRSLEQRLAVALLAHAETLDENDLAGRAMVWAEAARLDPQSDALGLLRSMIAAPSAPEPGQRWIAAPDFAEFIYHPSVQYRLGCTANDGLCRRDERFFRWVEVEGLWVDSREVTNQRYQLCVQDQFCDVPHASPVFGEKGHFEEPVVGVSWYDAMQFAEWAERRLPSEAEWERIARGTAMNSRYPWGFRKNRDRANVFATEGRDIFVERSPVGFFAPTGLGVFDIAGNVWEWTLDTYHRNGIDGPADGSPWTDGGYGRVIRGGSWRRGIDQARVSTRSWQAPEKSFDDVGFRCVIPQVGELSDDEILYRANIWFPAQREGTKAVFAAGMDVADRAYLRRRIVTGSVIEGRELEGLKMAVVILKRLPNDLVAKDLVQRVRSQLVEDASLGNVEAVRRGWTTYREAIESAPKLRRGLDDLKTLLAEMLREEGKRLVKRQKLVEARRCLELSAEFKPGNAMTRALLAQTRPDPQEIAVWEGDQREMVWIPAGGFRFGESPADRSSHVDERPPFIVSIDGFWIDRYEVTNAEYRRCVDAGACSQPPTESRFDDLELENHPVVGVDWYQALDYARWAGKRLPTEIEWERAARAGKQTSYPWGALFSPDLANAFGATDNYLETAPVGSFPPNRWGLFDMTGNVWEWVADVYHRSLEGAPRDGRAWTQPTGTQNTVKRVLRGGSYSSPPEDLRVSRREKKAPDSSNRAIGFRCAASWESGRRQSRSIQQD